MENLDPLRQKPDFKTESEEVYPLANDRKVLLHDNQGQLTRQEAFQIGCEHVWTSHVEPLQRWKDEAMQVFGSWDKVSEWITDNNKAKLGDQYSVKALDTLISQESRIRELEEENKKLKWTA